MARGSRCGRGGTTWATGSVGTVCSRPPRPTPVALPEIDINLFWHARYSRHPGSVWLRGLLVGLFADAEDTRLATA
jgi:hypothetical protein